MNETFFENLLNEPEGVALDFKRDQYDFSNADDAKKSELLKDILAFANAWRRATAYILIGVEEVKSGRSIVCGVDGHLEDSHLQQFVHSKVNRFLEFRYFQFLFEEKSIGIIEIPSQKRPFYLTKDFGKLSKNAVYLRRGSSTGEATPDEIAHMGITEPDFSATHDAEAKTRNAELLDRVSRDPTANNLQTLLDAKIDDATIVEVFLTGYVRGLAALPKRYSINLELEQNLPWRALFVTFLNGYVQYIDSASMQTFFTNCLELAFPRVGMSSWRNDSFDAARILLYELFLLFIGRMLIVAPPDSLAVFLLEHYLFRESPGDDYSQARFQVIHQPINSLNQYPQPGQKTVGHVLSERATNKQEFRDMIQADILLFLKTYLHDDQYPTGWFPDTAYGWVDPLPLFEKAISEKTFSRLRLVLRWHDRASYDKKLQEQLAKRPLESIFPHYGGVNVARKLHAQFERWGKYPA